MSYLYTISLTVTLQHSIISCKFEIVLVCPVYGSVAQMLFPLSWTFTTSFKWRSKFEVYLIKLLTVNTPVEVLIVKSAVYISWKEWRWPGLSSIRFSGNNFSGSYPVSWVFSYREGININNRASFFIYEWNTYCSLSAQMPVPLSWTFTINANEGVISKFNPA